MYIHSGQELLLYTQDPVHVETNMDDMSVHKQRK